VSEPTEPAAPAKPAETATAVEEDPAAEPSPTATAPAKTPPPTIADAGVDAEPPDAASDLPEAGLAGDAGTDDAGDDDAGPSDAGVDSSSNDPDASDLDAGVPVAQIGTDGGSGGILQASADAGLPIEKATNLPDAGIEDAGGASDAGPSDAGPVTRDPTAIAGGAGKALGNKRNNVEILIAGDRLRKYELGGMFGDVLASIPQWQQFIGTSGIDPVKDINHMLIGGPQLRESQKVVVVLDMNVTDQKARQTIDGIIKRSKPPGKWVGETPVPHAIAQADRGERIFALVPGKHMVVVMPAADKEQLKDVKKIEPFNKSSKIGISIYMVTPARAFRGLPFQIPDTLKWMQVNVIPTDDNGVDVVLEAEDKDESLAREHAVKLEDIIESVRKVELPLIGTYEVLGKTKFVTDGKLIRGETHVSRKQLVLIMGFAKKHLEAQAKPAADAGAGK
jgi:hypothetical protein